MSCGWRESKYVVSWAWGGDQKPRFGKQTNQVLRSTKYRVPVEVQRPRYVTCSPPQRVSFRILAQHFHHNWPTYSLEYVGLQIT